MSMQSSPFLLDPSPWPLAVSMAVLLLTTGLAMSFHWYSGGSLLLLIGFILMLYAVCCWLRDVMREGTFLSMHTLLMRSNIKMGFVLFMVSEVMFFFGFFWAFFHSSLSPVMQIGSVWPPMGIEVFSAWDVPFLNTLMLLTSGASCTWVQYALIAGMYDEVVWGFICTLGLSFAFIGFQFKEYLTASYGISDSVYGSAFYMLTGFHGFHVILGTVFLAVCFVRFYFGHFTPKSYLGFTLAAWYWHFVDVVWLLLFISVYCWGNWLPVL